MENNEDDASNELAVGLNGRDDVAADNNLRVVSGAKVTIGFMQGAGAAREGFGANYCGT